MTQSFHGGDILTYEERYGRPPLDFSANVNPLGMAPSAHAAAIASLETADRYPDPRSRALTSAIAAHEGVRPEWIVCGNGASDILYRIAGALAPARALVCAPTFSEYEEALCAHGCEVARHTLREAEDFRLTARLAEEIRSGVHGALDMVFLCEPNNPTGSAAGKGTLEEIVAACAEQGTTVVLDECFNGFLDDPAASTMKDALPRFENLAIVSAHTKVYGMAGLRLGYLICANERIADAVAQRGSAWPVSCVAQAAGIAAYDDAAYVARARAIIQAERPRIARALSDAGCRVYPSQANYLLFEAPDAGFGDRVASLGVLVRPCGNYHGLTARHFRCAVRTPEENDTLIGCIARAAQETGDAEGNGGLR